MNQPQIVTADSSAGFIILVVLCIMMLAIIVAALIVSRASLTSISKQLEAQETELSQQQSLSDLNLSDTDKVLVHQWWENE